MDVTRVRVACTDKQLHTLQLLLIDSFVGGNDCCGWIWSLAVCLSLGSRGIRLVSKNYSSIWHEFVTIGTAVTLHSVSRVDTYDWVYCLRLEGPEHQG